MEGKREVCLCFYMNVQAKSEEICPKNKLYPLFMLFFFTFFSCWLRQRQSQKVMELVGDFVGEMGGGKYGDGRMMK